jgi:hypothetical protein
MRKQEQIDPIPDEFSSYEEAAEFWETHDTTDYPDAFRTVEVRPELRRRHYEVEYRLRRNEEAARTGQTKKGVAWQSGK